MRAAMVALLMSGALAFGTQGGAHAAAAPPAHARAAPRQPPAPKPREPPRTVTPLRHSMALGQALPPNRHSSPAQLPSTPVAAAMPRGHAAALAPLPSHLQAPPRSTASQRATVAPTLGGPARYDPKKAALLGAALMPHKH
jgi:hypothetical protein